MSKHMEVIESHECDVLDKYNNGLKSSKLLSSGSAIYTGTG